MATIFRHKEENLRVVMTSPARPLAPQWHVAVRRSRKRNLATAHVGVKCGRSLEAGRGHFERYETHNQFESQRAPRIPRQRRACSKQRERWDGQQQESQQAQHRRVRGVQRPGQRATGPVKPVVGHRQRAASASRPWRTAQPPSPDGRPGGPSALRGRRAPAGSTKTSRSFRSSEPA